MTNHVNSVYQACSIVEGFGGHEFDQDQELQAWAYLIRTGACWSLQGWYGRNAANLIGAGVISEKGEILCEAS